jgi:hypothetical protein
MIHTGGDKRRGIHERWASVKAAADCTAVMDARFRAGHGRLDSGGSEVAGQLVDSIGMLGFGWLFRVQRSKTTACKNGLMRSISSSRHYRFTFSLAISTRVYLYLSAFASLAQTPRSNRHSQTAEMPRHPWKLLEASSMYSGLWNDSRNDPYQA